MGHCLLLFLALLFLGQHVMVNASKSRTDPRILHQRREMIKEKQKEVASLQRDVNAIYEPVRIHFHLDDMNLEHINRGGGDEVTEEALQLVMNKVILPAKTFYESKLSVIRVVDGLEPPQQSFAITCFNSTYSSKDGDLAPIPNTDLLITVRTEAPPKDGAADDFFPHTAMCHQDEYGRITHAYVDLTTDVYKDLVKKDDDQPHVLKENIDIWHRIMLHEMAHAFGLLEDVWTEWYDPDTGLPRSNSQEKVKNCPGLIIPDENVVRLSPNVVGSPLQHYELITPTVQAVVFNQFNCDEFVPGGRLESYGTNGGGPMKFGNNAPSCPGLHWDSRWFHTDFYSDGENMLYRFPSVLTFAAIEDAGWYQVHDWSELEPSWWGRGASCEFLGVIDEHEEHNEKKEEYEMDDYYPEHPCIDSPGHVPEYNEDFFCSYEKFAGCTNDNNRIGICTIRNYTHYGWGDAPIGSQYFDAPNIGTSHGPALDFCPVFQGASNIINKIHTLDCKDPNGKTTIPTQISSYGGTNSKCIETTNVMEQYPRCDIIGCPSSDDELNFPMSLCVEMRCNVEDEVVDIHLGNNGEVHQCEYDGQEVEIPDMPGHFMKCPRLAVICKEHFCPKNCIGRGICDYSMRFPKCQCNDPDDPSPYCANSRRFHLGELESIIH